MSRRNYVLSFVASALASFIAAYSTNAVAAAFVFDVHVYSKNVNGTFYSEDISFSQTFVSPILNTYVQDYVFGDPDDPTTFENRFSGFESLVGFDRSSVPFEQDLVEKSGLSASPSYQNFYGVTQEVGSEAGGFTNNTTISFEQGNQRDTSSCFPVYAPPCTRHYQSWSVSYHTLVHDIPYRVIESDGDVIALIQEIGTLTFTAGGQDDLYPDQGNPIRADFFRYTGTATLRSVDPDVIFVPLVPDPGVTAVPEPSSWALLIMGFGAAGSMIRRRKAVAACLQAQKRRRSRDRRRMFVGS